MKPIFLAVTLAVTACLYSAIAAAEPIAHKPVRIGYFHDERTDSMPDPPRDAFRARMKELGYIEGGDYVLEIDAIDPGRMDQAAQVADRIVARQPDIFVAVGAFFARQAKRAVQCQSCAKPVMFVFGVVVNPLNPGLELVPNLDKPGGQTTGVTTFYADQQRQRIEILKQAIPDLKRVAILAERFQNPSPISNQQAEAARGLGVDSRIYLIEQNPDLEAVFKTARSEGVEAVVVIEQPATNRNARRIAELSAQHKLPAIFAGDYEFAGGVFTFGATLHDAGSGIADQVDRIIKGAKPGDLPVIAIQHRPLTVNLKVAREIGLAIPSDLLKRAERVIE